MSAQTKDKPLTPEDLQNLTMQELVIFREALHTRLSGVQGQLTQWNDEELTGGYDEFWAAKARGAHKWIEKELIMVRGECRRRAQQGDAGFPKTKADAFVMVSKDILDPEERKRVWNLAEIRFPYLFPTH